MPTQPAVGALGTRPPGTDAPWSIDKRTAIGVAVGCLCLGIIVGFKLAGGEPMVIPQTQYVPVNRPCADCEEAKIQAARAAAAQAPTADQPTNPAA